MHPRAVARFAPLLTSLALVACGGAEPAPPGSGCATGPASDGTFTISLGSRCLRGVTARVRSDGKFRDADVAGAIDVQPTGDGEARVTLEAGPPPVEAIELLIPGVEAEAILQQGYQSWGFSGVVRVPDDAPADFDGAPRFPVAAEGDVLGEAPGVSYGSAVIGSAGGHFLVAGALSADRATTGVVAKRGAGGADVSILYGVTREPLPADGDGVVRSEPIHLADVESATEGLDALAAAMKSALPAGAPAPKRPPGGWYSWNEHFDQIDEALILAHVDAVAATLAPAGLPLVEIDDGWERAWGDWQANDAFPGGMDGIGAAITAKGLIAGAWMAPFLVDIESATGKAIDPQLVVRDDGGAPLVHQPKGGVRAFYVLDGTSAESMKVATDAMKALRAAGFRFFKLDYLYAGSIAGKRSRAGATGNQALRAGFALLREAAGDDAFINACGAPILPTVGWADSLRVGNDTAYKGFSLAWPFVAASARGVAARSFLWPLVWPDADQVQLRAPFDDDDARSGALATALAGPAYSIGDDLTTLDPARLAMGLAADVLDVAGAAQPAVAEDLFDAPADGVVIAPPLDTGISTNGTAAAPPSRFTVTGKSGTRYRISFAWQAPHQATVTKLP